MYNSSPIRALIVLWVVVLLTVLWGSEGYASSAYHCPTVQPSQQFTFVYGTAVSDSVPLPIGSVVEARNPRGDAVGCHAIESAGGYGLMYVYGEEVIDGTIIPGMRTDETILFTVNGEVAEAEPVLRWSNDWTSHRVDVSATDALPHRRVYLPLVVR